VARYSVYHVRQLIRSLKTALEHPGFSFIEVLSGCPVQFGRRNAMAEPTAMLTYFRDHCITRARAHLMSPEELDRHIVIGEFVR
jgi:2-oxoglutarate ferredoxin oxidoreductase subunit beta